jgi:hypothetical protein
MPFRSQGNDKTLIARHGRNSCALSKVTVTPTPTEETKSLSVVGVTVTRLISYKMLRFRVFQLLRNKKRVVVVTVTIVVTKASLHDVGHCRVLSPIFMPPQVRP